MTLWPARSHVFVPFDGLALVPVTLYLALSRMAVGAGSSDESHRSMFSYPIDLRKQIICVCSKTFTIHYELPCASRRVLETKRRKQRRRVSLACSVARLSCIV